MFEKAKGTARPLKAAVGRPTRNAAPVTSRTIPLSRLQTLKDKLQSARERLTPQASTKLRTPDSDTNTLPASQVVPDRRPVLPSQYGSPSRPERRSHPHSVDGVILLFILTGLQRSRQLNPRSIAEEALMTWDSR